MIDLKNSLESFNTTLDEAEEISELKDKSFGSIQKEKQKEQRMKNSKESLQELWDTMQYWNLRRRREGESSFKEIMAENFENVWREKSIQINEAHTTSNSFSLKKIYTMTYYH